MIVDMRFFGRAADFEFNFKNYSGGSSGAARNKILGGGRIGKKS